MSFTLKDFKLLLKSDPYFPYGILDTLKKHTDSEKQDAFNWLKEYALNGTMEQRQRCLYAISIDNSTLAAQMLDGLINEVGDDFEEYYDILNPILEITARTQRKDMLWFHRKLLTWNRQRKIQIEGKAKKGEEERIRKSKEGFIIDQAIRVDWRNFLPETIEYFKIAEDRCFIDRIARFMADHGNIAYCEFCASLPHDLQERINAKAEDIYNRFFKGYFPSKRIFCVFNLK